MLSNDQGLKITTDDEVSVETRLRIRIIWQNREKQFSFQKRSPLHGNFPRAGKKPLDAERALVETIEVADDVLRLVFCGKFGCLSWSVLLQNGGWCLQELSSLPEFHQVEI